MPIHVRELLKKHLPYTLSDRFSYLSSEESMQSIGWGTLDPEKDAPYANNDPLIANEPFSWDEYPEDSVHIEPQHQPYNDNDLPPFNPEIDDYDWDEQDCGGWNDPYEEPQEEDSSEDRYGEDTTGDGSYTGGTGKGKKTIIETTAFYKPFHFYDDWGIYIKEAPVLRLKRTFANDILKWLYRYCQWMRPQEKQVRDIVNDLSLRLAAIRYYAHEVFHHKVEAFATRCEAVRETPVYILGFHYTHRKTGGYWEEPLAECHMLKEIDNSSSHTWDIFTKAITPFLKPSTAANVCVPLLQKRIFNRAMRIVRRRTPAPYNRAPHVYLTWRQEWQKFQQEVLRSIGFQANALELMSSMENSYRYKNSKGFWIVVHKGGRPPRWMQVLNKF